MPKMLTTKTYYIVRITLLGYSMLNIDKRNFNKGESVQLRSVKNLDEPLSKKTYFNLQKVYNKNKC